MFPPTFQEYALSPNLTEDEIYTVELLIDRVQSRFDETYWDDQDERDDARKSPDYRPGFSPKHLKPAAAELSKLTWLSLQRVNDTRRPVRSIAALRYFPQITELILSSNEISDLSALSFFRALRRLCLDGNPVCDFSPLAGCDQLEELEIRNSKFDDLGVLETLTSLRDLSLSQESLPAFQRLKELRQLRELELPSIESFAQFPELPNLRVIRGRGENESLDGIDRFPMLENLVNFSGNFRSLEPLRKLSRLTHMNLSGGRIESIEPLGDLLQLRDIRLSTTSKSLDLAPLGKLPALREARILCAEKPPESLPALQATLTSWDSEFQAESARLTPSLDLEIVSQEAFDLYDTIRPFNVPPNINRGMLGSEREWLDGKLENVFALDFANEEDFHIVDRETGGRSLTVVLYSEAALEALPRLVLGMQKVLCSALNDWIVYFHTDMVEPKFNVWIYPDRIVTTKEYRKALKALLA